jgi:rubrerythrin
MNTLKNPMYMAMYELPYQGAVEEEAPGSPIERLRNTIDAHARAEAEALGQYEYLAKESGDPVIALVMRLVLEDEERHHGLLKRIEATLDDALNWTHSPNALPTGVPAAAGAPQLATLARELIAEERTGSKILRELATQQRTIDGGLHSLLIDMMAMDSEKHAMLLQFVQRRLEQRANGRATA